MIEDSRGEMRKDKDIKWGRTYEMKKRRMADNGDRTGKERVCGLWLIPILLIWQLCGC